MPGPAPAELGDRVLSAQPFQNNADLFFDGEFAPGLTLDLFDVSFSRSFGLWFLYHRLSLPGK